MIQFQHKRQILELCKSSNNREFTLKKIVYILSTLFYSTLHAYTMEDFEFYKIACERNDFNSCSHLAIIYEEAKLVAQDMKKAEKLYMKACGGDEPFACHNMAIIYSKNNNKALKKIALKFYEKACKGGYATSCIYLGRHYRDSHTLLQDYPKAKEMFDLACELNDRLGCKEVRILEGAGY